MSVRNQKVGTKSESGLKQSPKCCGLTLTCVTTTKIPIIFVGLGNEAKAEAVPAATRLQTGSPASAASRGDSALLLHPHKTP